MHLLCGVKVGSYLIFKSQQYQEIKICGMYLNPVKILLQKCAFMKQVWIALFLLICNR